MEVVTVLAAEPSYATPNILSEYGFFKDDGLPVILLQATAPALAAYFTLKLLGLYT